MFYRIKQFIKAVFARVTKEEELFVRAHLQEEEARLFEKLKRYEQRHCIDVALKLKELCGEDDEMIRLGLLHDIGKIKYPLNPIEKGLVVILDKISKGKIKKYSQYKMVKCYYEHPQLGYELLKQTGYYEEDFLKVIQKHHSESEEIKIKLLQEIDNLS